MPLQCHIKGAILHKHFLWLLQKQFRFQICADQRCGQGYHHECLMEWIKSVLGAKQSFNVMFGECPYCTSPIKLNVLPTWWCDHSIVSCCVSKFWFLAVSMALFQFFAFCFSKHTRLKFCLFSYIYDLALRIFVHAKCTLKTPFSLFRYIAIHKLLAVTISKTITHFKRISENKFSLY